MYLLTTFCVEIKYVKVPNWRLRIFFVWACLLLSVPLSKGLSGMHHAEDLFSFLKIKVWNHPRDRTWLIPNLNSYTCSSCVECRHRMLHMLYNMHRGQDNSRVSCHLVGSGVNSGLGVYVRGLCVCTTVWLEAQGWSLMTSGVLTLHLTWHSFLLPVPDYLALKPTGPSCSASPTPMSL